MKLSNLFFPPPASARHAKRTFVFSPEDEPGRPTREVIEFALALARRTLDIDLSNVSRRMTSPPRWPDVWPGEHYRLLAAAVALLQPKTVVEIGTHTGLSALSLREYLPPGGKVTTFDLVKWDGVPDSCLRPEDFQDGRLMQVLGDLSAPDVFGEHTALLSVADLMFIDGPKDGRFEYEFADRLESLALARPCWMIFDDIKDLNMLRFWRGLARPKLDLTTFGHWTGTGLVRWVPPGSRTA